MSLFDGVDLGQRDFYMVLRKDGAGRKVVDFEGTGGRSPLRRGPAPDQRLMRSLSVRKIAS